MAIIKCPECGNSVSDKAEKCPHCGFPLKLEETVSKCPECGESIPDDVNACPKCGCPLQIEESKVQTENEEVLIKQGQGTYYKNCKLLSNSMGTIYLTNKRISFLKVSGGTTFLLGGWAAFTKGTKPAFEILLSEINSISIVKSLGGLGKILRFDANGECYGVAAGSLKFSINDWFKLIQSTVEENTSRKGVGNSELINFK